MKSIEIKCKLMSSGSLNDTTQNPQSYFLIISEHASNIYGHCHSQVFPLVFVCGQQLAGRKSMSNSRLEGKTPSAERKVPQIWRRNSFGETKQDTAVVNFSVEQPNSQLES